MITWIKKLFQTEKLSDFDIGLHRDRLIASSRLLFIDDEEPLLLEELKRSLFSVDYDSNGNDTRQIDSQIYDVVILDYHGVGTRFGGNQGLELLKHIRRVSPRTRVIAYTSKSLDANESDFFRLSNAVLPKDLSLTESMAIVEAEIQKALSKEYLFEALVEKLKISDSAKKDKALSALVKALKTNDSKGFRDLVSGIAGKSAEHTVDIIVTKLFPTK